MRCDFGRHVRIHPPREREHLRSRRVRARDGLDRRPTASSTRTSTTARTASTPEQQQTIWEYVAKMVIIARDLMIGNPKLAELGFGEEALGHNAIAAGFQGQRQWTDHMPNGDFMETILNSSFDWNGIREAFVVATENDALNGRGDALRPPADRAPPPVSATCAPTGARKPSRRRPASISTFPA